jgi:hypothetical protein
MIFEYEDKRNENKIHVTKISRDNDIAIAVKEFDDWTRIYLPKEKALEMARSIIDSLTDLAQKTCCAHPDWDKYCKELENKDDI